MQFSTAATVRFAAKSLARAAARQLYRLCYNAPHWRVGWRFVDGPDVIDLRAHPKSGWRDLPDDRGDSTQTLPDRTDGRMFVFVEDFVHALGYGVISAVEFDAGGPLGTPRPVLDIGTHLSYPFVFARRWRGVDGARKRRDQTVDLYRAGSRFRIAGTRKQRSSPASRRATRPCSSTTGRCWMFATVRDMAEHSPMRCTSGRRLTFAGRGSRTGATPCWLTLQAHVPPGASCVAMAR